MSNTLELLPLKNSDLLSLLDDLHVEGYAFVCFIVGFNQPIAWVFMVLYVYFFRRKIRYHVLIFLCLVGFLSIQWIEQSPPEMIIGKARVVDIEEMEYNKRLTLSYEKYRFHLYTSSDSELGDVYWVEGKVELYRKQTVPKGFNAYRYFLGQGIDGKIIIHQMTFAHASNHLFDVRMKLVEDASTLQSKSIVFSMVFGENALDESEEQLYRSLGMMYLFSMSGLHIYFLLNVIKRLMFYLNLNPLIQTILIILFLSVIVYFYQGSYVILRILIIYILYQISRTFQLEWTSLDRIQIAFLVMMIMDIHLLFHFGFFITYLVLNIIHLTEFLYRHLGDYSKKVALTSIVHITILPFTRLFSPMMIPVFPLIQFVMSSVVAPLSLLVLLYPFLDPYLYQLMELINQLMHMLDYRQLSIVLPVLPVVLTFGYFIGIACLLRSKRLINALWKVIALSFIFVIPSLRFFQEDKVVFLDVGQGDTMFISVEECNILIDAYQGSLNYLLNHGIRHIDLMILTHSDNDHIHDALAIMESVNIKRLVLSAFDDSYFLVHHNVIRVKSGDRLMCGSMVMNVLGPIRDYQESNNNSIVLQMQLENQIFLFSGDIEKEAEDDLVNRYGNQLKSDILKISHHGSNTSSTKRFIQAVDPDVGVISLKSNNVFGFPHPDVITRLMKQDVSIFRTDHHGTVIVLLDEKKSKWKIHLP